MKAFCIFIVVFLAAGIYSAAGQDLIVQRDGSMIEAMVVEISPMEIRYRNFGHLDGPIFVIMAADVLSIRFENGMIHTIDAPPAPVAAAPAGAGPPAAGGATQPAQRNNFVSGNLGYLASGNTGGAFGLNFERMFERVSWGAGFTFVTGQHVTGGSLSGSFKFFPAPIFFLGANLGFSYRSVTFQRWEPNWFAWGGSMVDYTINTFGGAFTPEIGFRLGGRGMAFFADLSLAAPMHLSGGGNTEVNVQPSIRLGGAW